MASRDVGKEGCKNVAQVYVMGDYSKKNRSKT